MLKLTSVGVMKLRDTNQDLLPTGDYYMATESGTTQGHPWQEDDEHNDGNLERSDPLSTLIYGGPGG